MNITIDFTELTPQQQITIIDIARNFPYKLEQITNEITDDKNPVRFKESIYYICSLHDIKHTDITPFWICIPELHKDKKFIEILLANPNTPAFIKNEITKINLEDT